MPLTKTTTLTFRSTLAEDETLTLTVDVHEDGNKLVFEHAGDEVWISRADFAEIARQISEWSAGEPA